jgi:hypothetical protein
MSENVGQMLGLLWGCLFRTLAAALPCKIAVPFMAVSGQEEGKTSSRTRSRANLRGLDVSEAALTDLLGWLLRMKRPEAIESQRTSVSRG